MTLRDDVEALVRRYHLTAGAIPDEALERMAQDIVAEFGDREPTADELFSVLARYLPGGPSAKPKPRDRTAQRLSMADAIAFEAEYPDRAAMIDGRHRAREIRRRFGVSLAIYYATLHRALDDPACIRAHPELCARLARERDERRAARGVA